MTLSISKRLQFIANLINTDKVFADIGSDHAYLPTYVCLHNEESQAIAGEVVDGPFKSAEETVKKHGLEHRISVRLGNGLEVIKPEDNVADIVIAGMGGSLISDILETGKQKLQRVNRLIIQPNNKEDKVREKFLDLGFVLSDEYILEENELIYEILLAERKEITTIEDIYDPQRLKKELLFGPYLSKNKPPAFIKKWKKEKDKIEKTINQMSLSNNQDVYDKIKFFEQRLTWIKEVIS